MFLNTYGRGRASGVVIELQVAHVLAFRDDKCIKNVTYLDREEALKRGGTAPAMSSICRGSSPSGQT